MKSSMTNNSSTLLPLHEKILRKNKLERSIELVILFLLISLVIYRFRLVHEHGYVWVIALLSESWFTFNWFLVLNAKWNPYDLKTYPNRLLQSKELELPPVDLFVTTADPVLEPPIVTVNTVVSLLALDYPAHKLACYVSDDGASPITYYALVEAIKFAKIWIPFCNKYNIQIRAPFFYFSSKDYQQQQQQQHASSTTDDEFQMDSRNVKEEYQELCRKIEVAEQNSTQTDDEYHVPTDDNEEFSLFSKIDRRNHESIVKVIWENNCKDNGVPHLVYVSREKRTKYPHHYKAGAMNVLTRVSGVMTNSPFMLNVDCDMLANNPQVVLHAMCLLLGPQNEKEIAFVQCPQLFHGGLKDDPFGNSMVVLQEYLGRGIGGIQGPFYGGTGCFHRRKVIYGASPPPPDETKLLDGKQEEDDLTTKFGSCLELAQSASQTLSGLYNKNTILLPADISSTLKVAKQVADCSYETNNTLWGTKIGWVYGSTTEDILTGLGIHARGWRSVYCTPNPPAFLGCAPSGGPAVMTQQKRWATGLLEIIIGKNSPIIATIKANLWFRQCLAYIYANIWGLRSIPELCYALLPAYCLLTNTCLMPKVSECEILIPIALLVIYNLYTLSEYLSCGLSTKAWWNNQRMMRITTSTAFLFGVFSVLLKLLGISDTVFEITKKDQREDGTSTDADPGRFTFDESPVFVPGTALVLLHITALFTCFLRRQSPLQVDDSAAGSGVGEIVCSVWVLLTFLPFLKGMFGKGRYGIPLSTICKSVALVGFFLHFCNTSSTS